MNMTDMDNWIRPGYVTADLNEIDIEITEDALDGTSEYLTDYIIERGLNREPNPIVDAYELIAEEMTDVFRAKNEDYGNVFLQFRPTTFIDLIRAKLDRVENILRLEAYGKQPQVSEGVESEMRDIANYAVLFLIARGHADE